ncbi:hypothetical protein J1N35_035964 [Gossypium stocksii]|uniref:Apple domain-containing protein n=1 Tax=Gossypium stocksii TaxID=47602 RepID=A0A9D3UVN7_9ROSI|nr:hypothetical protein J1N35_035964 [Gossypium stocksii]
MTKNSCRAECYRDCRCEAVVIENESCKMMKLPLRFGRRVLSGQLVTAFLIGGELAGVGTRKKRRKLRLDMLIISIAMAYLTLGFLVVATIGVRKYRAHVRKYNRVLRLANEVEKLVQNDEFEEKSKLEKMVKVGLWCIQDQASSRPSIKKVILMLEGTVNIPDPPLLSSFVSSPCLCQELSLDFEYSIY